MKPIERPDGERQKATGFDIAKFKAAMADKGIPVKEDYLSNGKAYRLGEIDHKNGVLPRYQDNASYMDGWNSYEPIIIARTVGGKKKQYSLAEVTYHHKLPEWYSSISDALYYSRVTENTLFIDRINEHHIKLGTFEEKIARDSLIKPDVKRLYQSTIDGGISTSTDGGITWLNGGVMSSSLIPVIERRIEYLAGTSYRRWITVGHKATEAELKKGSLTKLKPPPPTKPAEFNEFEWWIRHIKSSERAGNTLALSKRVDDYPQDEQEYLLKKSSCFNEWELEQLHANRELYYSDYGEVIGWRCPCYYARLSAHQKAVKQYEKALEKWAKL